MATLDIPAYQLLQQLPPQVHLLLSAVSAHLFTVSSHACFDGCMVDRRCLHSMNCIGLTQKELLARPVWHMLKLS